MMENLSSQVDDHSKGDKRIKLGEVMDKAHLLRKIVSLTAFEGETYHAYWDRYMGLLEGYLRYVYEIWQVVNFFYKGMSPSTKKTV